MFSRIGAAWRSQAEEAARVALVVFPIAVATGAGCALFLWALDGVTHLRFAHPWLLFLLPLAGMPIAWLYEKHGRGSHRGNNLILDAIHTANEDSDSSLVPRRMAPLILFATLATHGFGGSAGREGTAVQMGGSLAAAWAKWLGLNARHTRLALMCGIAAGFGGVFGTPLAGAVFALEVLWRGRLETESALACLLAATGSDMVARTIGTHHQHFQVFASGAAPEVALLFKVVLAAIAFGLAARLFVEATHAAARFFESRVQNPIWRPFWGGLLLVILSFVPGARDWLGLSTHSPHPGAVTLASAVENGGANAFSWAGKTLFTAITLGSGFKGGEVTPLFYVGATLGNALSGPLHAPVALLAAMGFVAVWAGASKTPLSSTLLGIELFGAHLAPHFALACFVSTLASGSRGLYSSQKSED